MKKFKLFMVVTMLVALSMLIFVPIASIAYAEEGDAVDNGVQQEHEVVIDVETEKPVADENNSTIDSYFRDKILPNLIALGSGLLSFCVILIPYIKTKGNFKAMQGLYAGTKDNLTDLKKQLQDTNVSTITNAFIEQVIPTFTTDILKKVEQTLKEHIPTNYLQTLTDIKADLTVLGSQVGNIIEGAKIAWKDADGTMQVLSKSPSIEALRELYATVEVLKEKVANKTAQDTAELDSVLGEISMLGGKNEN